MRRTQSMVGVAFAGLVVLLAHAVASSQRPATPGSPASARPVRARPVLTNPVPATPASLAAGKRAYDANCAACHGDKAQGSEKAGVVISIIAEQGGRQPPDLTDPIWDHGASDGEIFAVVKRGVPPTMMAGYDGRISDAEIWSLINYLRAIPSDPSITSAASEATDVPARPVLELADFMEMPITGDLDGTLTRGQLARINFLREEPGGRRFFITDLNGPLYILDKGTRQLTTYLDFNGLAGRPGLFARLTFERNLATGLCSVIFDPDYSRNGTFYTIHMEDPTVAAPPEPRPGVVTGLDLAGYRTTAAIAAPMRPGTVITRESVVIEWTDRDIANTTFEGTARELLRLQLGSPVHPLGDITFNPAARPGDADWRVMYVGVGDSASGEQRDIRRLNPQRLDNLSGKILRVIPDLRLHTTGSTVSDNGRYRIPTDNPFVAIEGARREIWAVGLRNPHRLVWDIDPAPPSTPRLLAFNIGLHSWETVVVVKKGANYGYPLREGPQAMTPEGMKPVPADDTIPLQVTDTITRGTIRPTYPVVAYPHAAGGGDAIAGGVVYRGRAIPELAGRLIFGDITTGHVWYAEMSEVRGADDDIATTVAPIHALDAGLRRLVETTYRARGGRGETLPGAAAVSGRGRVDLRFAEDSAGELYVLTKTDGMIRRVVGLR